MQFLGIFEVHEWIFNYIYSLFPGDIQAFYDLWFVGDQFIKDNFNCFLDLSQQSDRQLINNTTEFYMRQFFNVKMVQKSGELPTQSAMSRTLNALIDAVNRKDAKLPKYIVVMMDSDILRYLDMHDDDTAKMIPELVDWFVRQIHTVIRRKRIDILEKKPGAGCTTKVIFVRMLRRIGVFDDRTMAIGNYRAKFNDSLNNSAAKLNEHMLTINSYNMYEHYQKKGRLSESGHVAYFTKLDNLLHHFDTDRIKLKPAPRNQNFNFNQWHCCNQQDNRYIFAKPYERPTFPTHHCGDTYENYQHGPGSPEWYYTTKKHQRWITQNSLWWNGTIL